MAETDHGALQSLARADVVQLRLSAMILQVLIERNVLSSEEAAAVIQDVSRFLKPEDPMTQAYNELVAEFQR